VYNYGILLNCLHVRRSIMLRRLLLHSWSLLTASLRQFACCLHLACFWNHLHFVSLYYVVLWPLSMSGCINIT